MTETQCRLRTSCRWSARARAEENCVRGIWAFFSLRRLFQIAPYSFTVFSLPLHEGKGKDMATKKIGAEQQSNERVSCCPWFEERSREVYRLKTHARAHTPQQIIGSHRHRIAVVVAGTLGDVGNVTTEVSSHGIGTRVAARSGHHTQSDLLRRRVKKEKQHESERVRMSKRECVSVVRVRA